MRHLQNRHRPTASPSEVQEYLGDIEFPQHKQALLEQVRRRRAPSEVREVIEQLPDRVYNDQVELENAIYQLE